MCAKKTLEVPSLYGLKDNRYAGEKPVETLPAMARGGERGRQEAA